MPGVDSKWFIVVVGRREGEQEMGSWMKRRGDGEDQM